ncbi:hypothetical protein F5050DRAFT_1569826 [Lentinula boryana]|uniref:Uncharacterized protein n=1 Tax=Lentinula boryana TaxID=40481 RepID=A0ABQ8QFC4_9AGAR|nr:hypothetical protein F5050DRAFT_1569826 [Lentinula boryana]
MILEEKALLNPPPPYRLSGSNPDVETSSPITVRSNNPYAAYLSARRPVKFRPSLSSLPSHLLLQIVYCTFPQEAGQFEGDAKEVLQRRTLHWLETSLRLVNHNLYIACMHILRSTYLPSYDSLIRPPYSSDPFPSSSYSTPAYRPSSSRRNSPYGSSSSLFPQHRELRTLDLFISVLAHEELLYDTSDLYLSRHEAYKDIFDLRQPRSRMEDLVAEEGAKAGLITIGDEDSVPGTPTTPQTPSEPIGKENSPYSMSSGSNNNSLAELSPVPFKSLTVSFSTRKVGLVTYGALGVSYNSRGRKRTIVEVQRDKDEALEVSARRLVRGLREWMEEETQSYQ